MSFREEAAHGLKRFSVYAIFSFLIPIGISLPLAIWLPDYKPAWLVLMSVLILTGWWLVSNWDDRKGKSSQLAESHRAIEEIKAGGKAVSQTEDRELTTEDRAKLQMRKWIWASIIGGVVLLTGVGGVMLVEYQIEWIYKVVIQAFVSGAALALLLWLWKNVVGKWERDIASGTKKVVKGILTDKLVEASEDGPDSYYLVVDRERIPVTHRLYKKYEVGDGIEIHFFAPWHNYLLSERKLT